MMRLFYVDLLIMQIISSSIFLLCVFASLKGDGVIQDFYWRDFVPGYIPYDAVEENNGRYIGQVIVNGFPMPAMIYPYLSMAAVTVHVKVEYVKDNIKILCSPDPKKFYWERVNFSIANDGQLKNVVKGGFQTNENVFIGRATHEGEWKIGKVFDINNKDLKGIWIWNKANERVRLFDFDLLKYNATVPTNASDCITRE